MHFLRVIGENAHEKRVWAYGMLLLLQGKWGRSRTLKRGSKKNVQDLWSRNWSVEKDVLISSSFALYICNKSQ